MKGGPFRPVKAVAVDLFSQTPPCEMLILFERVEHPSGVGVQPRPGPPADTHQKPGRPPLLSPLGQRKPALPEQHPDCITGRIQGLPKSLPCPAWHTQAAATEGMRPLSPWAPVACSPLTPQMGHKGWNKLPKKKKMWLGLHLEGAPSTLGHSRGWQVGSGCLWEDSAPRHMGLSTGCLSVLTVG